MTHEELQKIVEEIAVKVNHLAAIQITIASTVETGLKDLLRRSKILLAATENQELRLRKLEGRDNAE